jgi:hypothetical protein
MPRGTDDLVRTWARPDTVARPPGFGASDHRIEVLQTAGDASFHALLLGDGDGNATADRLLHVEGRSGVWGPVEVLVEGGGEITDPQLVILPDSSVHVFWSTFGGRVHWRVRRDGRWSASAEGQLPAGAESAVSGLGAVWDGRDLHVVWRRVPHLWHAVAKRDGSWSTSTLPDLGHDLRLAAGPDGTLAIAGVRPWVPPLLMYSRGSAGNVWVQVRRNGEWESPVQVHYAPDHHAYDPQVAWDGAGEMHALWLQAAERGALPTRLMHALSADGRVWTPAKDLLGGRNERILYSPRLAADGDGRMHATVARFTEAVTNPEHLHAYRAGGRWSRLTAILPELGVRDSELLTVTGPEGRVHAVWEQADGSYLHSALRIQPQPTHR